MLSGRVRAEGAAILFGVLIVVASARCAEANVTLPALFSRGMVLQQKIPVRLYGKATPGEHVMVEFQGQRVSTKTDANGKWSLHLHPLRPGSNFTMVMRGRNRIRITDVMVGEVWLLSGQSNIEYPLSSVENGKRLVSGSTNPQIHLFQVPHSTPITPQTNCKAVWKPCTPKTVAPLSAIGYLFGRALLRARHVPIGLIQATYSGTGCAFWLPEDSIKKSPELSPIPGEYEKLLRLYRRGLADYEIRRARRFRAHLFSPPYHAPPLRYSSVYNGMIAPIIGFTVRGVVWYQGESDVDNSTRYHTLLPTLIRSWRTASRNPNLPFLIVQLPAYGRRVAITALSHWAEIREVQRQTAEHLPEVHLIVTATIAADGDIHPQPKGFVADRLALQARRQIYGERIAASGPVLKSIQRQGKVLLLTFTRVGGGLVAKGDISREFTIAGSDHRFVSAHAQIIGKDSIRVFAPQILSPTEVRYGWADYFDACLQNRDGFPASPFRAEVSRR